jgi:Secreted repeat of unknown function
MSNERTAIPQSNQKDYAPDAAQTRARARRHRARARAELLVRLGDHARQRRALHRRCRGPAWRPSTSKRSDGTLEVTSAGHPLYYFAGRTHPGQTSAGSRASPYRPCSMRSCGPRRPDTACAAATTPPRPAARADRRGLACRHGHASDAEAARRIKVPVDQLQVVRRDVAAGTLRPVVARAAGVHSPSGIDSTSS